MKKTPATTTEARVLPIVPRSRVERVACYKVAIVGAALIFAFTWLMCLAGVVA